MGARKEKIAAQKMTFRRPNAWFKGSEIHATLPLYQMELLLQKRLYLQAEDGEVWHAVDHTYDPLVAATSAVGSAYRTGIRDPEISRPG
jgi:hypothetical protein